MADWHVKTPESDAEWNAYYDLRYRVLRQPWNQPVGSERADDDGQALHAMIWDEAAQKALAVGRISLTGNAEAQIRFMAVDPDVQSRGLGAAVLRYLEHKAMKQWPELEWIKLEAREPALGFYTKLGYVSQGKSYVLFDHIQHYSMRKKSKITPESKPSA